MGWIHDTYDCHLLEWGANYGPRRFGRAAEAMVDNYIHIGIIHIVNMWGCQFLQAGQMAHGLFWAWSPIRFRGRGGLATLFTNPGAVSAARGLFLVFTAAFWAIWS